MSRPASTPARRVLLVEGQDDKHVVRQLCRRRQSFPSLSVLDKDGFSPLLDSIGLIVKDMQSAGLDCQAIGILVDANACLSTRWDELRNRLGDVNVTLPQSPDPGGTIVDGEPRVGVWLMPDNKSAGELEDFVSEMIPDDDPVWPRSQCYIDGIPPAARKFTDDNAAKAQLYAWLAARRHPRLMGWAVRDGDLAVNGDLCQRFVAWLTRLFG